MQFSEYKDIEKLTTPDNKQSVEEYRANARKMTEIERLSTERVKTGVPLGTHCKNPFNGEIFPLWTADYALVEYGTGAVMAVPTHDSRDFDFAKKYNMPMKIVIATKEIQEKLAQDENYKLEKVSEEGGILINSGQFNGMNNNEAKKAITQWAVDNGFGEFKTQYRLCSNSCSLLRQMRNCAGTGRPAAGIITEGCRFFSRRKISDNNLKNI